MSVYTLFSNGKLTMGDDTDIFSGTTDQTLETIFNSVEESQEYLMSLSIYDLVKFFDKLSHLWGDRSHHVQTRFGTTGLNFLLYWFRENNILDVLNTSLRGNCEVMDDFCNIPGTNHNVMAYPRGIICHWLAGNIPMLGMLSLCQGILTKNANVIKVPKSGGEVIPNLLSSFNEISYRNTSGHLIDGEKLAKSIAAVYVDTEDQDAHKELSSRAHVRVSWGGLEAVESIMNLPRKYGSEDVIFGPKTSFMVVGKEHLASEKHASVIAKRASLDVSLLEQRGCNSPHTIFVEKEFTVKPEKFAKLLANQMEETTKRYPRHEVLTTDTMNILRVRAEYDMRAEAYYPTSTDWTVLYSEDDTGLATPCFNRTVFVRPIDNVMDVEMLCSHITQSVGVALSSDRKREFAKRVMAKGVDRCPDVGTMTAYEAPWDGMFSMDRFVRWCKI